MNHVTYRGVHRERIMGYGALDWITTDTAQFSLYCKILDHTILRLGSQYVAPCPVASCSEDRLSSRRGKAARRGNSTYCEPSLSHFYIHFSLILVYSNKKMYMYIARWWSSTYKNSWNEKNQISPTLYTKRWSYKALPYLWLLCVNRKRGGKNASASFLIPVGLSSGN